MRAVTAFEKLAASAINVLVVLMIFVPFYILITDNLAKKLLLVGIFFAYNLAFLIFNGNRCIGMMIMKMKYPKPYSKQNQIAYIFLYTLSFSTLLFWIFFPFDLFLLNIFALQLPTILIKKTTFHGYLSGNISTVSYN